MEFDPSKNTEFDENWAKIGKDEVEEELADEVEGNE